MYKNRIFVKKISKNVKYCRKYLCISKLFTTFAR